jgi:predicted kinase
VSRTVYHTLGRTASGKTTVSKFLSTRLQLVYISEAKLKRDIVEQNTKYNAYDSLSEDLRDQGYKAAIEVGRRCLEHGFSIMIDASFHRKHRRRWLYEVVAAFSCNLVVIYTICSNLHKTRDRILKRDREEKNEFNQADSFSVYKHVDATFEEPQIQEFSGANFALYYVNTDSNHFKMQVTPADDLAFSTHANRVARIIEDFLVNARIRYEGVEYQ